MSLHSSSSSSRVSSERSSTSGDHEAPNTPSVKRRLAAAPRTLTSIAQDERTQISVWKHISSGLPRAKRPIDLNRIDLVFPAELFIPPTPATSESEGSEDNTRIKQLYSSPWATKYGAVDALALHDRPVSTNAGIGALPQDASYALSPDPVAYNPVSILGAGRVDPFASYPIKMHRGEMWLLDQGKITQFSSQCLMITPDCALQMELNHALTNLQSTPRKIKHSERSENVGLVPRLSTRQLFISSCLMCR